MKDFIITIILGIILILLSSTNCFFKMANKLKDETQQDIYTDYYDTQRKGEVPIYLGDSNVIVQGEGDEFSGEFLPKWKVDTKQEIKETEDFPKIFNINKKVSNENYEKSIINKEITTLIEEEKNDMSGMLLTFWHGVAAVLIGEAGALLVALAWTKIYRNNSKNE